VKKIKIGISILLATTLLLMPSIALADDPPDTTITVVVVSPGDVDGQFGLSAGGDLTVGINGVDLDAIIAAGIAAGRVRDGDEFRYHLVTTNRDNIKEIIKFLNTLGYEANLAKRINLLQTQALNWAKVEAKKQDIEITRQAEQSKLQEEYVDTRLNALQSQYDEVLEVANHKVTAYANEVAQLRVEQAETERTNLFIVLGFVAGLLILGTIVGCLHRRLVLIKRA